MTTPASPSATNRIKVDDYGDMIAKLRDMKLVFYSELGSYQGDYLAVLLDQPNEFDDNRPRLFIYKDSYGSCSGCDWLQDEKDWETGEVDYKAANDYCSQMTPLYILPAREYSEAELLAFLEEDAYLFEFSPETAKELAEAIKSSLATVPSPDAN